MLNCGSTSDCNVRNKCARCPGPCRESIIGPLWRRSRWKSFPIYRISRENFALERIVGLSAAWITSAAFSGQKIPLETKFRRGSLQVLRRIRRRINNRARCCRHGWLCRMCKHGPLSRTTAGFSRDSADCGRWVGFDGRNTVSARRRMRPSAHRIRDSMTAEFRP